MTNISNSVYMRETKEIKKKKKTGEKNEILL